MIKLIGMEKLYTKEFMLAFLYNELPFSQKRKFILHLRKDPVLRRVFYDFKEAVDNIKSLKAIKPSETLLYYIRKYAAQQLDSNNCSWHLNRG
ncbi:MAG: hypothetical protein QM610_07735 [Chitinophagaceae bacterium]